MENAKTDSGGELVRLRQQVRDLEQKLQTTIRAGDELFYCLSYYSRVSAATLKDAREVWSKVRSNG